MSRTSGARVYDGCSIVALVVSLTGLLAMALVPVVALPLGAISIVLALVSRSRLRANRELAGSGISLAAFVLGVIEVASAFLPPLLNALLFSGSAIPID